MNDDTIRAYIDDAATKAATEATDMSRKQFEAVSERLEAKIDGLSEGLVNLNQMLDRTAEDIRSEMRTGFADTQAMIKFSHVQLDGRITALEQRVGRLESIILKADKADA